VTVTAEAPIVVPAGARIMRIRQMGGPGS
jgi:hypothetical protein